MKNSATKKLWNSYYGSNSIIQLLKNKLEKATTSEEQAYLIDLLGNATIIATTHFEADLQELLIDTKVNVTSHLSCE